MEKDYRGKHGKQYKISQNVINDLEEFLKKLPKYRSHYKEQNDERYLAANLRKLMFTVSGMLYPRKSLRRVFQHMNGFLGTGKKKIKNSLSINGLLCNL